MFRMLRDKCREFAPGIAHFDFEVAIHDLLKEVFPGAEVRFHLAKAWYRKLASLGLSDVYDREVAGSGLAESLLRPTVFAKSSDT